MNVLSGKESGVYIYKFSLLYRNIILNELGSDSSGYIVVTENWVRNFEKDFIHYIIK